VGAFSERIAKVKMGLCGRFFTAKTENVFGYSLLLDCDEYSVYKRPIGSRRIEAAYGTVVIVSKKNKLFIYPDYRYPQISYKVVFNKNVFPGLIEGSRISYCRVIPYFRYISKKNKVKAWRLIVVTNRGQIYHNYPSRFSEFDGASSVDDIKRFEESVVWDLPGRKYPCDRKEHAQYERYFPGLPEAAYQYHPDVNKSGAYSNGGFPAYRETAEGVLSRFYIPCRVPEANPFFYMSGFSADYKMALGLLVLYPITQIVHRIIEPKLLGDSVGLPPLLTLVLIYIGYKVGSVLGMIFAVPIGIIIINMYKARAFDYILDDAKILLEGILDLRKK